MNNQQISHININGFKSIKNCSVEMKMINVLIGSNGAGKSNFISVFRMLQDIIELQLQTHVAVAGGAGVFLYNGIKQTEKISINFEFGDNSYGFELLPTVDDKLVFADEYFCYSVFNYSSSLGQGHSESKWRIGVRNRINDYVQPILKNQTWRVYHFHDTGKNARVKGSCNIENDMSLQFDAGNLAAYLLKLKTIHKSCYDSIVKTIQLIAPFFRDFELTPYNDKGDIKLRWKQFGSEDIFNANQFSDGTLRFICLAVLLLQPAKLQPQTIIIDEPELGLHPYAITIFSELVKKVSESKQVIISTQSVELLSEFDTNDIIVVDKDENGSTFRRLNEDDLIEWLQNDYSLGELWKKNLLGGRVSR